MTNGLGFSPARPPPKSEKAPPGLSAPLLFLRDEPMTKKATMPTVTAGTPHEMRVLMV